MARRSCSVVSLFLPAVRGFSRLPISRKAPSNQPRSRQRMKIKVRGFLKSAQLNRRVQSTRRSAESAEHTEAQEEQRSGQRSARRQSAPPGFQEENQRIDQTAGSVQTGAGLDTNGVSKFESSFFTQDHQQITRNANKMDRPLGSRIMAHKPSS